MNVGLGGAPEALQGADEGVSEGADDGLEALLAQSQVQAVVEAACLGCGAAGTSRVVSTAIPSHGEVVLSCSRCKQCGSAGVAPYWLGEVREKGAVYSVVLTRPRDLRRYVVKSETASVAVPELELEIPARRAQVTTLGAILADTVRDLQLDQPTRRVLAPAAYEAIQVLCERIAAVLTADAAAGAPAGAEAELGPLSVVLDDPTGRSWVELLPPEGGQPKWSKREYVRTGAQNAALGMAATSSWSSGDAQMGIADGLPDGEGVAQEAHGRRTGDKAKAEDALEEPREGEGEGEGGGGKRRRI